MLLLVDGEALRLWDEAALQLLHLSQEVGGRCGAFDPAVDGFSKQILWRTAGQEGSAREPGCEIEGHLHEEEFLPHAGAGPYHVVVCRPASLITPGPLMGRPVSIRLKACVQVPEREALCTYFHFGHKATH